MDFTFKLPKNLPQNGFGIIALLELKVVMSGYLVTTIPDWVVQLSFALFVTIHDVLLVMCFFRFWDRHPDVFHNSSDDEEPKCTKFVKRKIGSRKNISKISNKSQGTRDLDSGKLQGMTIGISESRAKDNRSTGVSPEVLAKEQGSTRQKSRSRRGSNSDHPGIHL